MSYGVTLKGLTFPDFNITFNLTDTVTNVDDVIGLAVTQDTSAANSVKLATDGAEILGRILVHHKVVVLSYLLKQKVVWLFLTQLLLLSVMLLLVQVQVK